MTRELAQSNVDRPFEALQPWDYAVRFRTDTGLMVEYAVPHDDLSNAEGRYGRELGGMVEGTSVRVEIRDGAPSGSGFGFGRDIAIRSVLLSGVHEDVAKAHEKLLALSGGRHAGQTTQPVAKDLDASPSEGTSSMDTLRASPVRSQQEAPSSIIMPFDFVVRSRDHDLTSVEMCVPEIKWQAMSKQRIPEMICSRNGVTLHEASTALVEDSHKEGEFEIRRYLWLTGSTEQLASTHATLSQFHDQSVADIAVTEVVAERQLASQRRPASAQAADASQFTVIDTTRGKEAVRVRLAIPANVNKRFNDRQGIFKNIRTASGCLSVKRASMANNSPYLRIVGPSSSVLKALSLIQLEVNAAFHQDRLPSRNVRDMIISDVSFKPAPATHYRRLRIPHPGKLVRMILGKHQLAIDSLRESTECDVVYQGSGTLLLRGAPYEIEAASKKLFAFVENDIEKLGLKPASVEVLAEGELTPKDPERSGAQWPDDAKQTESLAEQPVGPVEPAPSAKQPAVDKPRATHYAEPVEPEGKAENNATDESASSKDRKRQAEPVEPEIKAQTNVPSESTSFNDLKYYTILSIPATGKELVTYVGARISRMPKNYDIHVSRWNIPSGHGYYIRAGNTEVMEKAKKQVQEHSKSACAKFGQPEFEFKVLEDGAGGPATYLGHPRLDDLFGRATRIACAERDPETAAPVKNAATKEAYAVLELLAPSLASAIMERKNRRVLRDLVRHTGVHEICDLERGAEKRRMRIRAKRWEDLVLARDQLREIVRLASRADLGREYGLEVVEEGWQDVESDVASDQVAAKDTAETHAASSVMNGSETPTAIMTDRAASAPAESQPMSTRQQSSVDEDSQTSTSGAPEQATAAQPSTSKEASTQATDPETARLENPEQLTSIIDDLRTHLRQLTYPVAIVTAREPGDHRNQNRHTHYRGVTVSSFTAVALHPVPIISFNLKVPSRTWDAIAASERIAVHLLSASPTGAAIAHTFTKPYEQAHEPFLALSNVGAGCRPSRGKQPPQIFADEGVKVILDAVLLKEKTVSVGDHLVLFAEVRRCLRGGAVWEGREALAYGMQGYRGLGEGVVPREPEEVGKVEKGDVAGRAAAVSVEAEELSHASYDKEANANASSGAGDEVNTASDSAGNEYFERMSREPEEDFNDEPAREHEPAAIPEGASVDVVDSELGLHTPSVSAEVTEEAVPTGNMSVVRDAIAASSDETPASAAPEAAAETDTQDTRSDRPTEDSSSPAHAGSSVPNPFGTSTSPSTHARNTSKQPAPWGIQRTTRSYSTSTKPPPLSENILKSTVEDYLAPTAAFAPRSRHLLQAQKAARLATEQLEKALETGSLTPAESSRLESTIALNERKVAKKLALNAAFDLRGLLDRGKTGEIDPRRVSWMEGCIERGLAVLLEEAKLVRELLEEGRLGREEFEKAKGVIAREHEVMNTEVMRLRGLMDEDEDVEFGVGDGDVEDESGDARKRESGGFDGFRGNV